MKEAPEPKLRRKFTKLGIHKFKDSLSEIDWSVFHDTDYCIEYLSEFLVTCWQSLVHKHFPLRKYFYKMKSPINWYNVSLHRKRNILTSVKLICNVTKNPAFLSTYHALRKEYLLDIKNAKRTAYNKFLRDSENKVRDTWKIVNNERNSGASKMSRTNISHDTLNIHFATIADKIIETLPAVSNSNIVNISSHYPNMGHGTFFSYQLLNPRYVKSSTH